MLVPKDDLDSAIAINNTSYNVSRAIGPALGGFTIAAFSIDFPFWCYCVGNLVLAAAVLWWRAPRRIQETLPAERFASAVRTGLRYVRHNRDMDSTIIRARRLLPVRQRLLGASSAGRAHADAQRADDLRRAARHDRAWGRSSVRSGSIG